MLNLTVRKDEHFTFIQNCGIITLLFNWGNLKVNVIDKRKMLEGLSYMFNTSKELTEQQMDALILIRDTMRQAGLLATADQYGRIVVKNRDQRQVAIGLFV